MLYNPSNPFLKLIFYPFTCTYVTRAEAFVLHSYFEIRSMRRKTTLLCEVFRESILMIFIIIDIVLNLASRTIMEHCVHTQ